MEDVQGVCTNTESEGKEGDVQYVCAKEKEEVFSELHLAAERGDTEAVRSLLMSSANVDVLDTKYNTPLHLAVLNGNVHIVSLLLNKNASVNYRNALGQTSLHLASEEGHFTIAQMLLKSNADVHVTDHSNKTPIDIAAMRDQPQLVQLLMTSIEFRLKCVTSLHFAAKCGNTKDVQRLLLNNDENPDSKNLHGDTPLHLASENGHFEVVEVLLRNNADFNILNASGKTALHIASELGFPEIVKAMLDDEGEVNAVDRYGENALHHAARNGHRAVVNDLLHQTAERDALPRSQLAVNQGPPAELELSQHPVGNTADIDLTSQHQIAAQCDNFEIENILSSLSSTVDAVGKRQATPLRLAVERGHADIGKNLMLNEINVNACNNAKMSPLHLACQNGHTSIVEMLLDNHATVDVRKQREETPFYLAAKNGHADISDVLLRRGVSDFVLTEDEQTPLHAAVAKGHTEVVEVILKHSSRISEKLTKGGENLQENYKRGVMPVEFLKSDGRRVFAEIVWTETHSPLEIMRDSRGYTPLVLTTFSLEPKMVQLLLSIDQSIYSETDIMDIFLSIMYCRHEALSDPSKYRINFGKLAQFIINSSKFNIKHQDSGLNTVLVRVIGLIFKYSSEEPNWLPLQYQLINDVIQLLLEKGADFNMKNSYGETPLIIASEKGLCDVIQILFNWEHKSGIKLDLNARDRYGATALIKAAEGYHVSAVRLLLNHKASVNLYNYCGVTALHTAVYNPNREFDLCVFCKGLFERKFNNEEYPQVDHKDSGTWNQEPVNGYKSIYELEKINLPYYGETIQIKEEMVKLLLANDETNVNAIDFRGNTPLDLAWQSSKRKTSVIFEALKNRGAIRNLLGQKDEAPIEMLRADEGGRSPLHQRMISYTFSEQIFGDFTNEILLRQDNVRHLANATDNKGRTPLHYHAELSDGHYESDKLSVLLEIGSNINADDMYGKTPLHYAELDHRYEHLVQYGANENTKDKKGHTPKKLKQLRESVTINEYNAEKILPIGKKKALYLSKDIAQILNTNHVTELSKRNLVETIRIYSQSPRPEESSEEAIWKIWTENEFIRLNRRLSKLKPPVQHFIERLADGIKEKDWRFECHPTLVGSAEEETKATISADFDFNFTLIKFSQLCAPFPHPLGPKGYFQLRRKSNDDAQSPSEAKFDSFFNSDHCLLTDEVNSRFKIILEEVLDDHNFWQDEQLFERNLIDDFNEKYENQGGLCKTLKLRMIYPIEDGESGFLFVDISFDIVACIQLESCLSEVPLPFGINPSVKTNGSILVFDYPRFNTLFKPKGPGFLFSETFARISFAPLESQIIKESSLLMKAAYIVCKMILYSHERTTYQLKTCLLFYMEAHNARNGSETREEDEFTPKELAFWVERIMFCFMEFDRHDVFPCYFMPSFKQQVAEIFTIIKGEENLMLGRYGLGKDIKKKQFLRYSAVYDIYLDLCPDDNAIDIPITGIDEESLNTNHDPNWEPFDREEFIRKLSSRNSS